MPETCADQLHEAQFQGINPVAEAAQVPETCGKQEIADFTDLLAGTLQRLRKVPETCGFPDGSVDLSIALLQRLRKVPKICGPCATLTVGDLVLVAEAAQVPEICVFDDSALRGGCSRVADR